jgi:hypothetical protein
MKEYKIKKSIVIQDDFYCENCGGWVYCPEMNEFIKDNEGKEIECIGAGCCKTDDKGEFIECVDCNSRFYLED